MSDGMSLEIAELDSREAPPLTQIVHGPITFVAHCERHGMPFFGKAYVGYVPTAERIVRSAGVASIIRTAHDCAGPHLLEEVADRSIAAWRGRYTAERALRAEFLVRCRQA